MSRILYFTTVYDRPVGGVRTIFRHVEELRGMGFDAYVVSNDTNEPPTWFETTAPILSMKPTLGIMADDVFVYPEVGASFLEATAKLTRRRVVFVQNQDGLFEGIKDYPNWEAAGVEHALYCSRYVAGIAERMFRFKSSQVVRCVVDRAKFKPGPKRSRVVTMPRKRQRDLPVIRQAFEHMWPQYTRLPWFTLHGVGEDVVASHMSEAAVFLSLSWREGLGLPPLEAMASGALVAGFTGLGGREYASQDNGLWVAEDDLFAAADAVGQALRLTLEEPDKAAAMRQAGFATADHYSAEGMRQDLRSFWENFLRG
jgi:hypothetical protein